MSVNVYVKDTILESSRLGALGSGKNATRKFNSSYGEHTICNENGRYYFAWTLDTPIPEELAGFVDNITCHEYLARLADREAGIYFYKSVTCELTPTQQGHVLRPREVYFLNIKQAKSLADIKEFIHYIKIGQIRPDVSYEGPQGGKSRQQLENELTATQQRLGTAWHENEQLRETLHNLQELHNVALSKIDELKAAQQRLEEDSALASKLAQAANTDEMNRLEKRFRELADKLSENSLWPFCYRRTVADQIETILNGPEMFVDPNPFSKHS